MAGGIRRHWKGLLAGAVVFAVLLVVGVPYVYIHFIEGDQPAPLSLSDVGASSTVASSDSSAGGSASVDGSATADGSAMASADASGDSLAGTWTVGAGSQAGYRVQETLAGQGTEAVGRTDQVTGSMTITDSAITSVQITVQVGAIASDNSQRDRQFQGRIMDTSQYPTATFTLTQPIPLTQVPAADQELTLSATGDLVLHGTTQTVTIPLTVKRTADGLAATGSLKIAYADYGIDNPSVGGFVSVGDSGTIEFLIAATRG